MKGVIVWSVLGATAALPLAASAETGTWLHAYRFVTIDAPASTVWTKLRDFHAIGEWHPEVQTGKVNNDRGNWIGAKRKFQWDDATVWQRLDAIQAGDRSLRYSVYGTSEFPVTRYSGVMSVVEHKPGKSTVIWRGQFQPKGSGDAATDAKAIAQIEAFYDAGLGALKRSLERG